MSPLMFFMLSICLKLVKVEETHVTATEKGPSLEDEELQELIDEGYYKYSVEEVEHEVNYMNILIFTKLELRIAVKDKRRFWTNGIVPYVISKNYDSEQKKVMLEGMNAFKNRTCIHFTPRKNESAFIFIQPGFGCSATVGKVNKNIVKLGNGCYQKGIVIHELMHVLGFFHEQSRPDRDQFVKINFDNISEKQKKNFDKFPEFLIQTGNISYDYGSIMHYGAFTFAKNKSIPTIIPLQKGVTIGQRRDFSKKDLEQINIFYNCSKQERRRIKRNHNADPSEFGVGWNPVVYNPAPLRGRVPAVYPPDDRQVEYDSRFAPVDYSSPKFTPVRNPGPHPRPVYIPEVYQEPVYLSEDHRVSPIHSKPIQAPVEYQWPSYSPVESPKSIYRPAEQPPKESYFSESHHSFYESEIPRRLNISSVEYQAVPRDYYVPPSRNYHRPEFYRPSYTTPGYHRLYPPKDYPKSVQPRPTYTTAGYRRPSYAPLNYPKTDYPPVYLRYTRPTYTTAGYSRPSYAPMNYPKTDYPPVYPRYTRPTYTTAGYRGPSYEPMNYPKTDYPPVYPRPRPSSYSERYSPVTKPYTQPYYETTLSQIETTAITERITTATTNTPLNTEISEETETETSTSAPTSTVATTTTAAPTSTVVATTTAVPTYTVAATTTTAPTYTVAATTTTAPTYIIYATTTVVPISAIAETTSVETTAAPVSTQEQEVITTVGITPTTCVVTPSTEKETYEYDLTSRNSEFFGTDEKTHSVAYHKIHVFTNIESRTVLKDPSALWTRGVVPYEFSDKYDSQQKGFLLEAIQEFHDKTCVRFVPRRNQATYIFVEPEVKCSAHIGKVPGSVNTVTISEGCYLQGTIIHELMHTLGFVHEQNRPDRDQYVIVMWDNIASDGKKNFRKYTWDEVQDFGIGYDYESVMHYGSNEFAEDPDRPTLVPLQAGVKIGQRDGFSKKDLTKINRLYNCRMEQDREPVTTKPIEEFKKYFQSNIQRLFRNLLRAIQNFRPSKPKN